MNPTSPHQRCTQRLASFHVRAVQCDYRSDDEAVYLALKRATAPLTQAWERLRRARRIAIKFNQDFMPTWVVTYQGHRQQLVSDPVIRATLRLLSEQTQAQGEGFALANVCLADQKPAPTRPQPRSLLPAYALWISDGIAALQARAYQRRPRP